jgi:hypothetical protein
MALIYDEQPGQVREYRNRQCENARYRALVGAQLNQGIPVKPRGVAHAALMVGSSPAYVIAMERLLQAEAWDVIGGVLFERVPLLPAAESMRARAQALAGYRACSYADRAALGDIVGVDQVWDELIVSNLS